MSNPDPDRPERGIVVAVLDRLDDSDGIDRTRAPSRGFANRDATAFRSKPPFWFAVPAGSTVEYPDELRRNTTHTGTAYVYPSTVPRLPFGSPSPARHRLGSPNTCRMFVNGNPVTGARDVPWPRMFGSPRPSGYASRVTLAPPAAPDPYTRSRYWTCTRSVVSNPMAGSWRSSVTFVPPYSTFPYRQMVVAEGLFTVDGFGATRASHTSRNTRSMRLSEAGGGFSLTRFAASVTAVPATGTTHPFTTAVMTGDVSPVAGRPNRNWLEYDGSVT